MAENKLDEIIRVSLVTDRADEDITTGLVVDKGLECSAVILARQEGIISGQEYAARVFSFVDDHIDYAVSIADGEKAKPSDTVAEVTGRAASVMAGERTALNFLGHFSGIATMTSLFVDRLRGSGITVLDTRKTTPGLRIAEKKAVRDGGGGNHRMNLADYILVKENHIAAAGSLANVIRRLGERLREAEIEVDSMDMLVNVLKDPPGRIMLDNFNPGMVAEAAARIDGLGENRPELEVSGGITLDNVESYALPGVDYISVGSLTASSPALDLSLILKC